MLISHRLSPPHDYLPKVAEILESFLDSRCDVKQRVSCRVSPVMYCYLLFFYQLQNLKSYGRPAFPTLFLLKVTNIIGKSLGNGLAYNL